MDVDEDKLKSEILELADELHKELNNKNKIESENYNSVINYNTKGIDKDDSIINNTILNNS